MPVQRIRGHLADGRTSTASRYDTDEWLDDQFKEVFDFPEYLIDACVDLTTLTWPNSDRLRFDAGWFWQGVTRITKLDASLDVLDHEGDPDPQKPGVRSETVGASDD